MTELSLHVDALLLLLFALDSAQHVNWLFVVSDTFYRGDLISFDRPQVYLARGPTGFPVLPEPVFFFPERMSGPWSVGFRRLFGRRLSRLLWREQVLSEVLHDRILSCKRLFVAWMEVRELTLWVEISETGRATFSTPRCDSPVSLVSLKIMIGARFRREAVSDMMLESSSASLLVFKLWNRLPSSLLVKRIVFDYHLWLLRGYLVQNFL